MNQKWYQKSSYRNLVDMHIANGDARLLASFDAEAYAENMKTAGFDTVYIYASNCLGLCLYPSMTGYRHQITRTRDIFGETVNACRARGIRVVGYLNNWSTTCYDEHPTWRVVDAEGHGYRDHPGHAGRYGVLCPNSPYRAYFLSLVKEVVANYPIEGLWVDMVGFWRGACYCESCREKFKAQTGKDIPLTLDWSSPLWQRYVRFKTESLRQYAEEIVQTAKAIKPHISVSLQSAGWALGSFLGFDEGYFTKFDYAAGDFYTDAPDASVDCRFLRAVSQHQPFEYMVSRCPTLTYHTVSKPEGVLRQQAYSAILHGGAFLAIDAIDPEGTMNAEIYRTFGRIRDSVSPYHEHPSYLAGTPYASLGVYVNYASAFDPSQNGMKAGAAFASSPLFARLKSIDRALTKHHLQYDIVTPLQLDKLSSYPLIVLSGVYTLSEEEIGAFRAFVAGGGRLYVSGRCATYLDASDHSKDETLLRKDFGLSDVLGVSLVGELPYDTCYIVGAKNAAYPALTDSYPPATKAVGAPRIIALNGTEVLATATLPYSSNSDGCRFVSAISDPPWEKTDIPALTCRNYGKGAALYSALLLEADKNEAVQELWLSLIEAQLPPSSIAISAPSALAISLRRDGDTLYAFLLNTLWEKTRASAGKSVIRVPHSLLHIRNAECFPAGCVNTEVKEDHTLITLEGLPEFAVLTLT